MLILELKFSGETLIKHQKLKLNNIFKIYSKLLCTSDFSIGILLLGFSYSMVMVFGMSMPFIVEHHFNLSAVVSGYCALASGIAIFLGGFLSKYWIDKPFYKKLWLTNCSQFILSLIMLFTAALSQSIYTIVLFVMFIHFWEGFTYNVYFTYSLTRFPEYAATSSGLVSGGSYILFSIMSYVVVSALGITNQYSLSESYLTFTILISLLLLALGRILKTKISFAKA